MSRSARAIRSIAVAALAMVVGIARARAGEEREPPPERVTHERLERAARDAGAEAPSHLPRGDAVEAGPVLSWSLLGPAPIDYEYWSTGHASGRVSAIAIDPRDGNKVYLAAAQGGVWKTTDGGAHWSPLTDGLSSLASGALAIDPAHPDTILYATGELHDSGDSFYGDGLFRSVNAGATWTKLSSRGSLGSYVARIAVHGTNSNIVYSAGSRGFNRSIDGGVNWQPTLTVGYCYDLAVDPLNHDVVYTAAYGSGIYKSIDAGATWTQLTIGLPASGFQRINLAIAPSNGLVLYASFSDPLGNLFGMYRTMDGGANWTRLVNTPDYLNGQGWYDNCVIVDPTDPNLCYAGGVFPYGAGYHGVIRTADGGVNWGDVTIGVDGLSVHPDQHIFAFGPAHTLWLGNDGGVWKTGDGGAHWTDLNTDLAITQFYSVALHPTNANRILGGTQDNGTLIYTGVPNWPQVESGDGGQCLFLWNDPNYYYTTYVGLNPIEEWYNDGFLADVTGPWGVENDRASFILGPLSQDPNTPNTLLAGTYRVWRTQNGGTAWDSLSSDLTFGAGVLRSLSVANGAPNTIYVGTNNGLLWVTTDAVNWNLRQTGLPTQPINDVMIKPTDPLTAYICSDTPGGGRVWRTADAGVSWTDVSGDLPSTLRGLCLEVDWNTSPPVLYLGTDYGIYRSADGGAHWTNENSGLPSLSIYDLKLSASGSSIVAATHGRGMWRGAVLALAVDGHGASGASLELAAANPARPPATIEYRLPARGAVELAVYDLAGRVVRSLERGEREAGVHRASWDGCDQRGARLGDGVYFYRLTAAGATRTIKVAMIR